MAKDKKKSMTEALAQAAAEHDAGAGEDAGDIPETASDVAPPEGLLLAGKPMRAFSGGDARVLDKLMGKLQDKGIELDMETMAILAFYIMTRTDIPALLALARDEEKTLAAAEAWYFTVDIMDLQSDIDVLNEVSKFAKLSDNTGAADEKKTDSDQTGSSHTAPSSKE
jgi:hypothetical protein